MNKLILMIAALLSTSAFASYNTDVPEKAIQCVNGNLTVKIDAKRSQILLISAYDPSHPEKYNVEPQVDTDGDTFRSYTGIEVSIDPETVVTLTFDDRGDTLVVRHDADVDAPIKLKCH
jgi:hypothetical protein